MKEEIKVPAMGESISEAVIGAIFKASGSAVNVDDEILELETDKVNQPLYAQQAGTVHLNVASGQTVNVGQAIGYIEVGAQAAAPPPAATKTQATVAPAPAAPLASAPQLNPVKPSDSKPAAGGARYTKDQLVEELKKVKDTPAKAASAQPAVQTSAPAERPSVYNADKPETRKKMPRIRQVIAQRLVEAQHQAAMLTTFNEVDMSVVMGLREKYKEAFLKAFNAKLGFMSFFVKAVVEALKDVPQVNAYIDGDELVYRQYYDIGIAVGTEKGLIVPVLRQADQLSFGEVEQQIENFAKKAREGTLTVNDIQGGCFTITNGGVYGSLLSTPILNPPQSGILGMHKIEKRPVVVQDQVVIRPMMYLALSYDHRVIDGKEAVSFLVEIKNFLEDPSRLLLGI